MTVESNPEILTKMLGCRMASLNIVRFWEGLTQKTFIELNSTLMEELEHMFEGSCNVIAHNEGRAQA
jgi:hypothetical protein